MTNIFSIHEPHSIADLGLRIAEHSIADLGLRSAALSIVDLRVRIAEIISGIRNPPIHNQKLRNPQS
jgi:hypothetical protein